MFYAMLGELLSVLRRIIELRANFLKHSQKSHIQLQWPCINTFDHCVMSALLNWFKLIYGLFGQSSMHPTVHRGAFCQILFRWNYYYGSNESTGKETAKTHLSAVLGQHSISAQTSQGGTKCTKAKKWLRSSCSNIYYSKRTFWNSVGNFIPPT